jgi:hypothetical protein
MSTDRGQLDLAKSLDVGGIGHDITAATGAP